MPGCVFRAGGREDGEFDADAFLGDSSIEACKVFKRGEPAFPASRGVVRADAFNANVSDADGSDIAGQIADAFRFLDEFGAEIDRLRSLPGVKSTCLDFGVNCMHDTLGVHFLRFPPALLERMSRLGIELEVSIYPPDGSDEDEVA
jgi:hypothetical protein